MMKKKTAAKPVAKKASIKKYQDGGILTPDGRLKSRKTRNVSLDFSGNEASVSKKRIDGKTVTKKYNTSFGYIPIGKQTKTVTNKEGEVLKNKEKNISPTKAEKKISRVVKNTGRNKNDTYSYKKGGTVKKKK